jgi:CheY-like chemotaxis protein
MAPATGRSTPEPRTLLLVHGDILVRTALAAYLRECGYDVVEAGTTEEAIQALRLDMKFDLAFLDVEGDEGAGFQLAQTIRKHHPRFASCWRPACPVPRPKPASSASRGRRSASPTTTGHWNGTSTDCSRGDPQMRLRPRGAH